uniref:4-hydroxythreonine-4-phosphate dehydrogenase PdxA n=1 Tax=Sphingomonas sp. TaxID=28214 RepID=UPI0025EAD207
MRSLNIAEGTPAPLAQPVVQPLAVSMGDPAGIGPEILAKAWAAREQQGLPTFFAVGDARAVAAVWDGPIVSIGDPAEAAGVFVRGLPVLGVDDGGQISPGHPDVDGARCALHSLEVAAGLARSDAASALVTGPVSKAQLYQIGFTYPGQTEFIAERCGIAQANVVMMLAGPSLRTVPVTIHTALADVPRALTTELIVSRARVTARSLQRDFGIAQPRLAVAGLNPHAGEGGTLGREELDV